MEHDDVIPRQEIEQAIWELEQERDALLDETCENLTDDQDEDTVREEAARIWEKQTDSGQEWRTLTDLLEEMGAADYLIAEDYFPDYVEELLKDCGDIPPNLPWYVEIDWNATAKNVRQDYSELEWDGHTYLYQD